MIPRSTNPHTLLENTQIVSRTALNEAEGEDEHPTPDLSLVNEFNRVMKRTLPSSITLDEGGRKRSKIDMEKDNIEEPLLFRLVSYGPPIHISLEPKPEPYLKVREPEAEDSETQAEERMRRALAVAVDADWVEKESRKPNRHPSAQSNIKNIVLLSSVTPSSLMIFCYNKPVQRTTPPVADVARSYGCPVVDVNLDDGQEKRKRRRKRAPKHIEHRFWKPDPSIRGKCMGYAMGYNRRYLAGAS